MKNIIYLLLGMTALLGLDILSKLYAVAHLQKPISLLPGILQLSLSYNTGIAFSIPVPQIITIVIAPLLIVAVSFFLYKECDRKSLITHTIAALFIAGGLGNFLNRLTIGAVVDFIDFSFWPSFNIADSYITIGVFLICLFYGKIFIKNE